MWVWIKFPLWCSQYHKIYLKSNNFSKNQCPSYIELTNYRCHRKQFQLLSPKDIVFFTAHLLTCHIRKTTGVTNNINNGSVISSCPSKPWQWDPACMTPGSRNWSSSVESTILIFIIHTYVAVKKAYHAKHTFYKQNDIQFTSIVSKWRQESWQI